MPLPGRRVSAGALVLNQGATHVAPSSRRRGDTISKYINGLGTKKNLVIEYRPGPKPKITLLARASINLLLRYASHRCYMERKLHP
jgi:hypothetical protein